MDALTAATGRASLSAAQWASLAATGHQVPPGFGSAAPAETAREGEPDSAALAALTLLRSCQVTAQLEAEVDGLGRRAILGIAGPQAAGIVTAPGDTVEVVWFPTEQWAAYVTRCVPVAAPDGPAAPLALRVLPLAAITGDDAAPDAQLNDEQVATGDILAREARGMLRCLVSGKLDRAADGAEDTTSGAVETMWVALPQGWVGLRPAPDGSGRQLVELVDVDAADLPSWLAPDLAVLLDIAAENAGPSIGDGDV